ncbi:GDP-mannose 4,6-dehydratase [candidate division WOR-3 bacterium]|nr:GDP-mannose 4,6-dehydratase [candidate division WOR-3 bacterium]
MISDQSSGIVLITGSDGFIGSKVALRFAETGNFDVYGTYLSDRALPPKKITPIQLDITDFNAVYEAVNKIKPDIVYHFAAQSSAGFSFGDPFSTYKINFTGTLNFLEALKNFSSKFIFISSSEVYGDTQAKKASEDDPISPLNPYGASKAAAEIAVFQHSRTFDSDYSVIRPFPQIGAGQNGRFFVPSMAKQIMDIKKGIQNPVIKTGNLLPVRTFISAEDSVELYFRSAFSVQKGQIYNLSGNEDLSLLQILQKMLGIAEIEAQITQSNDLLRTKDPMYQLGSSQKIRKVTDYEPCRLIEEDLKEILDSFL